MKLPKSERGKVGYCDTSGELRFIMAQKGNGSFILYRVANDELIKLGKGIDPKKLEENLRVYQIIREK